MAVRLKGHEIGTKSIGSPRGTWRAECSCGYRSTTRMNEDLAAAAALHHVTKVIAEYRRNGLTPPLSAAS